MTIVAAPPRRRTNAPYEPIYCPEIAAPWTAYLAEFLRYCEAAPIDGKETGATRLILLTSQRYLIEEVFAGLSLGIHDFVIVKARQLGASSVLWALLLWWLTKFPAMLGMYLADDEGNKEKHRGLIGSMYLGLLQTAPGKTRGPWVTNNKWELRWRSSPTWRTSRLDWAFVNRRAEGRLGIGRGINVLHGTEIDTWDDEEGVAALQAALADRHPRRLYVWEGTGRGYGMLYSFWQQAESSTTTRRIFVAFWRRDDYVVAREERAKWNVYGRPPAEPHEMEWAHEVKRRFGHTITREQLAFWRWKKAEGKGIDGDQAKALEQYPWLPEHAFQAAGSAFLSPMTSLRIRRGVEGAPPAQFFRVDWGATFDEKDDPRIEVPKEVATLTIWEEKQPGAVYVVAGDPAYGSSEDADSYAVTIWRCHPDQLVQVAEYESVAGTMYQFAWLLAYLAGYYEKWLIYDVNGPGMAVLQELKRMAERGLGLSRRYGKLQDVIGNIQHYLWAKPDTLTPQFAWGWKTGPGTQEALMEQLRNEVERGALVVRSPALMGQLTALVRNKTSKRIEAGGVAHDDLAVTAAMAVEYWLGTIQDEIEGYVAPRERENQPPQDPGQRLLQNFFANLREPQGDEPERRSWGVRIMGPGR